jgi:predicted metal-dependent HD superfamily phosphohydrolase
MGGQYLQVYNSIYSHILAKLQNELSPRLTYHCPEHTLDMLEQSVSIAEREGITDEENLFLLKIAALYHDTGFIYTYAGHEARSCELCRQELPLYGLTALQIDKICGMIMATKIPQSPGNIMEQIICDADLDYLGRDDFETISNSLYNEFTDYGFVKNYADWMQKQVSFFKSHQYFTKSSRQLRAPKKNEHLEKINSAI